MRGLVIIFITAMIIPLTALGEATDPSHGISSSTQRGQRAVEWTGGTILVKATYNQITEIRFPEEIATVLSDSNQLSVIVKDRYLYIKPLVTAADENMYALAASGASYPLRVTVGEERDSSVEIFARKDISREVIEETAATTPLSLMKAMMRGEALPGFEIVAPEDKKPVYGKDGFLEIRLLKTYTAPLIWGYVLYVENKAPFPVRISPQEINVPGLLAISIDEEYLAPRATRGTELIAGHYQTVMYLVIEPGSSNGEIDGLPGLVE